MTTLNESLSQNLKLLRKKYSYSQEKVAEKSGLHRTYIGAIERGERNVSLDAVEAIGEAFDISPLELLQ